MCLPGRLFEYTCGKLAPVVTENPENPDRRERINTIRTIGALSTVGFSFVLAVLIGGLVGWWLDRKAGFEKYPVFFLLFLLMGLIAGALNVIRAGKNLK